MRQLVVTHRTQGHVWILRFTPENALLAIEQAEKWAACVAYRFSPRDAVVMSRKVVRKMRRLQEQLERGQAGEHA